MTKIATVLLALSAAIGFYIVVNLAMYAAFTQELEDEVGEADIWGVVRDKETGSPLENVTVTVMEPEMSTTTKADGVFHFEDVPRGERTLVLNRTGYLEVEFRLILFGDMEEPPAEGEEEDEDEGIRYLQVKMEEGQGETQKKGADVDLGLVINLLAIFSALAFMLSALAAVGAYFAYKCKTSSIKSTLFRQTTI